MWRKCEEKRRKGRKGKFRSAGMLRFFWILTELPSLSTIGRLERIGELKEAAILLRGQLIFFGLKPGRTSPKN